MSLASMAYREVEALVETWTKKYQYHISLVETKPNEVKFMVEFSLPQPQKPVPIATIRVYFTCTNYDVLKITFRFEKDSLIHSPNKTIRQQEIEKWIDDSLHKKLLVRQTVFYLGTAYDSTRVQQARQDQLLREEVKPIVPEHVWIHPDLLSDQRRLIDIMEKPHVNSGSVQKTLQKHFQEIDKENIGVLTQPQFLTLIKNIGVKLNPIEQKDLLKRVDPSETGMVEYVTYEGVISEFIEGFEAKGEAEGRLKSYEEEEIFGSILMLIDDQAQDIEDQIVSRFRANDEDETGRTDISQVKNVLDEINKGFKEANKPEPLTVIELSEVSKILTDLYGYKDIPYDRIHRTIIDYKIKELAAGRVNSRMNNLEVHLKQIFEPYDDKKQGKIKIDHFEEALVKSEKINLLKAQIYLLKSLISIDVRGEVNYVDNSKFLSEFIKKLYLNSSKRLAE